MGYQGIARPFDGDSLMRVDGKGRTLKELSGKPVLLRFHIQAAKLYSFWVE